MPACGARRAASRGSRIRYRDIAMLYLSQLLGTPVEDLNGVRIGKIIDVMVPRTEVGQAEPTYPSALLVEGQADQNWHVPIEAVEWHGAILRLRVPVEQLSVQSVPPAEQELSLAHEVLDKQVIDIERKKAVRVNDVCLGDDWVILGIDNSTLGLVRRLAPSWLLGTKSRRTSINLIPWERIESIVTQRPDVEPQFTEPSQTPRTPSGHLAELHPAD